MEDPEQALFKYASSRTDEAGEEDSDMMFIKIISKDDNSRKEEPKAEEQEIMRRKLDPRENANGGVRNFTERIKGMHVFVGNFTYVVDFMIIDDISSIIDPRFVVLSVSSPNEPKSRVFPPNAFQMLKTRKGMINNQEKKGSHSNKGMRRKERVTRNVLDAVIQVISLAIVQKHLATKIKRLSLEVLGAIAKMTSKTKTNYETCLMAQSSNEDVIAKDERGLNGSSLMNEAISKGFVGAFGIVRSRPLVECLILGDMRGRCWCIIRGECKQSNHFK
nr:MAK10-like protein [Tanacetum cinerariifolium]